jgi:hypothetical protein
MKLTRDYKEKFLKTYEDFKNKISVIEKLNDKEYSLFFPMIGENFESKKTLLVVGRACNGWEHPWKSINSDNSIVNLSISCSEGKPMQWLIEQWTDTKYKIKRSSFWRIIKNITLFLNECNEKDWPSFIAWSNLFKISPYEKGNPNMSECDVQLQNCIELFEQEIEELKPEYVLLIVGLDWGKTFLESIASKIEYFNNEIVKCVANYKDSKLILTVRPEGKKQELFINSIKTYL